MQFIQSEIWKRITAMLDEYNVIHEQCETPRKSELDRIFDDMCTKFEATLTDKQRKAFNSLINIADSVRLSEAEHSIAIGMCIARELDHFIKYPALALQHSSATHKSVSNVHEHEISVLKDYFSSIH